MLVSGPVMDCFVFTLEACIVFILKSIQAGCNTTGKKKESLIFLGLTSGDGNHFARIFIA
jgi:hypothetical protein